MKCKYQYKDLCLSCKHFEIINKNMRRCNMYMTYEFQEKEIFHDSFNITISNGLPYVTKCAQYKNEK